MALAATFSHTWQLYLHRPTSFTQHNLSLIEAPIRFFRPTSTILQWWWIPQSYIIIKLALRANFRLPVVFSRRLAYSPAFIGQAAAMAARLLLWYNNNDDHHHVCNNGLNKQQIPSLRIRAPLTTATVTVRHFCVASSASRPSGRLLYPRAASFGSFSRNLLAHSTVKHSLNGRPWLGAICSSNTLHTRKFRRRR